MTDPENYLMSINRFTVIGIFIFSAACGLVIWQTHTGKLLTGEAAPTSEQRERLRDRSKKTAAAIPLRTERDGAAPQKFYTYLTLHRLREEHERAPTLEEWPELVRVLIHGKEEDMVEAVKVRFSVYAGAQELALLKDAYEVPQNDEVRQRVIEIFGSLQSPGSVEVARQILNDDDLPITHHLVNACAVSLARRGEQADVEAIFRRLNSAGEDEVPDGSLYSEADGLMGAIGILQHPDLESFLCAAAAGRGAAVTGRARAAAAAALCHYPTVASTTVLYQLTQTETNPMVRKQAEEALAYIRRTD